MNESERNLVIGLLEQSLDSIAMENVNHAEQLINRAIYWLSGMEDDDLEDEMDELAFGEDR